MSSNDTSFLNLLNLIALDTNRYGSLVVFIVGSVGVIFNILIFGTDQELKKNPCSRLFLASSIASFVVLFAGLPVRFFSTLGFDATERYDALCKCFMVVLLGSFSTSALLTSYLSIERWLNSCANARLRMIASMKNAYRAIIITIIVVFAFYSQIFYCNLANQKNPRGACSPMNNVCLLFNDFMHLTLFIIIPCVIMLIFGSLTLHNIKQNLHRVTPALSTNTTGNARRTKRTQSTITILMFTQVCLLTSCNLPAGIQRIYSTITASYLKSPQQRAIENIVFQFVFLFTYIGVALPFYLYTLMGAMFREALVRRIRVIFHCRLPHQDVSHASTRPQIQEQRLNAIPPTIK